ncbi:MAG: NAD(P)/FAD-dependent oxidoreductase [Bdellovibrio sp.]
MTKNNDVLIIGGGIIGMATAYELSQRGAKVTLIDKGEVGYGCSYGNAGWVTPCFAMPLPMPGMLLKSIGWLMDPDSPLYIKPTASPMLFSWLFRFLRSMNQPLMLQSIKSLVEISKYSVDAYAQLNEKFPNTIGYDQKGLLMVSQTDAGLAAAEEERRLVEPHGIPGSYLSPDEVRKLEPAIIGDIKGGVYFPKEAHLEPLSTVKTLAAAAVQNGVTILPQTEVYDFVTENNKIKEVHTTRGIFKADKIVLATGSWSPELAKKLELNVPVLGGKGYALILKTLASQPKIPLMLVERKIAVTPRANSIRLAGTLELVNPTDYSITPRRVNAILNGSRLFLDVPEKPEVLELWRGLRPCTPDGVPVIGFSTKYNNLLISAGHQMLGIQSGPGSAKLASDLVLGETPLFDPHPFRASRF